MGSRKGKPNMTPEQEQTLLQLVAIGLPQSNAAEVVDLHPSTVTKRKGRDPLFLVAIGKARAKGMLARLSNIMKAKDWRAHAWYLERQFPEEFARPEIRAAMRTTNVDTKELVKAIHQHIALSAARHAPKDALDAEDDFGVSTSDPRDAEPPRPGVTRS